MIKKIKPSKVHYNRAIKRWQGLWIVDTKEEIIGLTKSFLEKIATQETFEPHYPAELAIKWGITKGHIVVSEQADDKGYYSVTFTEKGLQDAINKSMKTCAFTGRTIRGGGEF